LALGVEGSGLFEEVAGAVYIGGGRKGGREGGREEW